MPSSLLILILSAVVILGVGGFAFFPHGVHSWLGELKGCAARAVIGC